MSECLRCPYPIADDRDYERHLVEVHFYSAERAKAIVRGEYLACCDQRGPAHSPGCQRWKRALQVVTTAAPPAPVELIDSNPAPPAPEETPMPRTRPRAQMKCKGCGAPGRRRDSCPKCNGETAKPPKPPKSAPGGKPAKKTKARPAVRKVGGVLDAKAELMLAAAKARVTQLRADLASEEKRVEVLMELVGA